MGLFLTTTLLRTLSSSSSALSLVSHTLDILLLRSLQRRRCGGLLPLQLLFAAARPETCLCACICACCCFCLKSACRCAWACCCACCWRFCSAALLPKSAFSFVAAAFLMKYATMGVRSGWASLSAATTAATAAAAAASSDAEEEEPCFCFCGVAVALSLLAAVSGAPFAQAPKGL